MCNIWYLVCQAQFMVMNLYLSINFNHKCVKMYLLYILYDTIDKHI